MVKLQAGVWRQLLILACSKKDMQTDFIGYPVSNLSKKEIISKLSELTLTNEVHLVTVMNANKMYLYDKFELCKASVDESKIILPENAIHIGMSWLKKPLKEWDIGGVEIAKEILLNSDLKVFLLGAKHDVLEKIVDNDAYRNNIVGYRDGYFQNNELVEISNQVNALSPDIILLGLGSPKQEVLMQTLKINISRGVLIGVGGTFDVLAGVKKDAPKWTKRGLEWLYRAIQDPKKFKRYLIVNSYYLYKLLRYKLFSP